MLGDIWCSTTNINEGEWFCVVVSKYDDGTKTKDIKKLKRDGEAARVLNLIGPVAGLLDKFIEDKDQKNALAHEIATLAEKQAHEAQLAQIEVNKAEAQHRSIFVSGWRPFVGWTCGVALAYHFYVIFTYSFSVTLFGVQYTWSAYDEYKTL